MVTKEELKALKILKHYTGSVAPITFTPKVISEAIEELEQYEQNFKQREFDYRTECQDVVSAARLEADEIAKGGLIEPKKATEDISQVIKKLEENSTFFKLVGYESDGRE